MSLLDVQPGVSGYMNLTAAQRGTIQVAERVGASLSLAGVLFVIFTYALFKKVRNVSNTFIFYASVANVGASIACLIGYDGIAAGDHSALCQAQAFLLEMFMQSDPWWSLSMAVNVFMVFFLHYNADVLMKYMWIYALCSFGLPAIPAFICLFYYPGNGQIYGNATLWCWIGDSYNSLRIFSYYVPIWTCIFLTTLIYLAIGYHVFHGRNQLRDLTMSTQVHEFTASEVRDSAEKSIAGHTGTYGTVTTEVQITTADSPTTRPATPAPSIISPPSSGGPSQIHPWTSTCSDEIISPASPTPLTTPTTNPFTTISSVSSRKPTALSSDHLFLGFIRRPFRKLCRMLNGLDPIKLAYLRTSFIFAVSVLVTWTPSSINRVYTLMYPARTNYPLNLASAIVLPLQGVWNVVIYVLTTWEGLNEETYKLIGWAPAYRRNRQIGNSGQHRFVGHHGTRHSIGGGQLRREFDSDELPIAHGHGHGHAHAHGQDGNRKKGTVRILRNGSL